MIPRHFLNRDKLHGKYDYPKLRVNELYFFSWAKQAWILASSSSVDRITVRCKVDPTQALILASFPLKVFLQSSVVFGGSLAKPGNAITVMSKADIAIANFFIVLLLIKDYSVAWQQSQ